MRPCLELLESRDAPGFVLHDGVLTIRGTRGNDRLALRIQGDVLVVVLNRCTSTFALSEVHAAVWRGRGGQDRVRVELPLPAPPPPAATFEPILAVPLPPEPDPCELEPLLCLE